MEGTQFSRPSRKEVATLRGAASLLVLLMLLLHSEVADAATDATGRANDDCPGVDGDSTQDRHGCLDTDGDGWSDADTNWSISDGADALPEEPSQWEDRDSDGWGDNETLGARFIDHFPDNPSIHRAIVSLGCDPPDHELEIGSSGHFTCSITNEVPGPVRLQVVFVVQPQIRSSWSTRIVDLAGRGVSAEKQQVLIPVEGVLPGRSSGQLQLWEESDPEPVYTFDLPVYVRSDDEQPAGTPLVLDPPDVDVSPLTEKMDRFTAWLSWRSGRDVPLGVAWLIVAAGCLASLVLGRRLQIGWAHSRSGVRRMGPDEDEDNDPQGPPKGSAPVATDTRSPTHSDEQRSDLREISGRRTDSKLKSATGPNTMKEARAQLKADKKRTKRERRTEKRRQRRPESTPPDGWIDHGDDVELESGVNADRRLADMAELQGFTPEMVELAELAGLDPLEEAQRMREKERQTAASRRSRSQKRGRRGRRETSEQSSTDLARGAKASGTSRGGRRRRSNQKGDSESEEQSKTRVIIKAEDVESEEDYIPHKKKSKDEPNPSESNKKSASRSSSKSQTKSKKGEATTSAEGDRKGGGTTAQASLSEEKNTGKKSRRRDARKSDKSQKRSGRATEASHSRRSKPGKVGPAREDGRRLK